MAVIEEVEPVKADEEKKPSIMEQIAKEALEEVRTGGRTHPSQKTPEDIETEQQEDDEEEEPSEADLLEFELFKNTVLQRLENQRVQHKNALKKKNIDEIKESDLNVYETKVTKKGTLLWEPNAGSSSYLELRSIFMSRKEEENKKVTDEEVFSEIINLLTIPRPAPKSFIKAKKHIMPRIRDMSVYEVLKIKMKLSDKDVSIVPHRRLDSGTSLAVELVWEQPQAVVRLTQGHFKEWNTTFDDLLPLALKNLEELESTLKWRVIEPDSVFASPWQDNNDASRLLLPSIIRRINTKGAPVVFVPNQDILIVCGSEDSAGLKRAAELCEKFMKQSPQPVSGIPLVMYQIPCIKTDEVEGGEQTLGATVKRSKGSNKEYRSTALLPLEGTPSTSSAPNSVVGWSWREYVIARSALGGPSILNLRAKWVASLYAQQKDLDDALWAKENPGNKDKLTCSALTVLTNNKTTDIVSYCVWPEGTTTTLPKADLVMFTSPKQLPNPIIAKIPWETVMKHFGKQMRRLKRFPERWEVSALPSATLLQAAQEEAKETFGKPQV